MYTTEEYTQLNPTYHVEDSPWKAAHILRMLRANKVAPQTVAEVGCGAGEILRQLQGRLPPATEFDGYEISPAAFELCRSRANSKLRFHCVDLISRPAAPFDLCLCLDVIEHVPDYIGFIKALRSKAHYKLFHIPLDLSVLSVLRAWPILRSRKTLGHIQSFFKDTALATLGDAGYEVIDWFYTSGVVDRPATIKARMLRVPRVALYRLNRDFAVRLLGGYSIMVLAR
jgi:Methyltransferase domain